MSTTRKERGYWTIERSIEEAEKYQHRSDFKKGSYRAYEVLKRHGLLEQSCLHMAKKDTIRIWTKDACVKAAKQCKTKSEFAECFNGAYVISKRKGWFDELLQYFTPVGSKYKRCIYACEFPNNHAYVGLTYDIDKRIKQHLNDNHSAVYQYIQETKLTPNFKQITDYMDYQTAAMKEGEILNEYKDNGWVMLNRRPTGGLGSIDGEIIRKWTKEKCIQTAKECSSYTEFNENYPGAVDYANRHHFIDEIKKIIPPKNTSNKKWTKETALEECRKYETLNEFQNNASGAYMFLIRNGLHEKMREGKKILQRDEWTFEEAKKEALKYRTKAEFRRNANGCYQVSDRHGWMKEITKHMEPSVKLKYNEEMAKNILTKFSQMEQLKKSEDPLIRGLYWWLKSKKKLIEYKKYLHGDPLNTKRIAWTNELILDDIKQYKTYSEYRANGRSYQFCKLHGLLNNIKKFYCDEKIWF